MENPKLSIITVNLNNNEGLKKTINSVKMQVFTSYEHIIIDAGSIDESKDTILQYQKENKHLSYWVSEPDKGIYDGMNKGIEHACGEYFLFLNSGDCLKKDVLNKIPFDGTKYIYGDVETILPNKQIIQTTSPYPLDPVFIILKDTICHQVCFIHKSLFVNQKYRTDYKLASDWIHIVENITIKGCSYKHIPIYVTQYDGNGISATSGSLGVDERMKWINENIPSAFYHSLIELGEIRAKLHKIENSELGSIIPIVDHTRKFAKRAKKLILFLYKINSFFSTSKHRKRTL